MTRCDWVLENVEVTTGWREFIALRTHMLYVKKVDYVFLLDTGPGRILWGCLFAPAVQFSWTLKGIFDNELICLIEDIYIHVTILFILVPRITSLLVISELNAMKERLINRQSIKISSKRADSKNHSVIESIPALNIKSSTMNQKLFPFAPREFIEINY